MVLIHTRFWASGPKDATFRRPGVQPGHLHAEQAAPGDSDEAAWDDTQKPTLDTAYLTLSTF